MPGWAELQADQVVELIATFRGGGEAQPAAGRDLLDRVLERRGGHAVAHVHDDQPVSVGKRGEVVAPGEGLQGGDVDDAGGLGASAAALSGLDAEQVVDAGAPLVGEGLAVYQYQRGHAVVGDDDASDHGLAGAGWGDQYREFVTGDRVVRGLLLRCQACSELEFVRLPGAAFVGDLQFAAGLRDERVGAVEQAARQD